MGRYYFDVHDKDLVRDKMGSDFMDVRSVETEAIASVLELAKDAIPEDHIRTVAIHVRDETDKTVFKAAVTLEISRGDAAK